MTDRVRDLVDALRHRYALQRELGRGGMATVYLARDLKHDRLVALKVLHPHLAATVGPERFVREVRLAARLQHPHILPLFDSGESLGQLWYTMPYVEGESLRDRLRRERQLDLPAALRIARESGQALQYAHEHGVVHRDIKPENILLTRDGNTLVADFGVAKAVDSPDNSDRLTETGLALGTPAYMSPEQASADQVDPRSDIYSLGCVLYEMLAGEPPFTGPTPQAVIAKRLSTAPVPPGVVRHAVPPALDAVVMRALAREPVDRFPTAAEFASALESPGPAAPLKLRVSHGALIAAGVATLALAAWLALSLRRGPRPVDATVVAVAPFRITGADPSLAYLREGLVDLLAAKLGGTSGLRATDTRSLLAAWRSAPGSTDADVARSEAIRVAARLGAGQLVLGDLVGTPGRMVVHATVVSVPAGAELADAMVDGPSDSLLALVDRLAGKVLLLRAGEEQQRVASLTTTSLQALRAYLNAQALYRRGRFADATRQYEEAVRVDSSFALAGLMLLQSAGWYGTDQSRDLGYRVASRYSERLSERDRSLLDATPLYGALPERHSAAEYLRAAERYVQLAPDSPEAWALLADDFFHYGFTLGLPGAHQHSIAAFKRALELDSTFVPALEHLPTLYGETGDTSALRNAIQQLFATDSTADDAEALRWYAAMKLGDSTTVRASRARFHRFGSVSIWALGLSALQCNIGVPDISRAFDALRASTLSDDRKIAIIFQQQFAWDAGRPAEARRLEEELQNPNGPVHAVQAAIAWGGDSAAGAKAARTLEQRLSQSPPVEAAARDRYVRELFSLAEYRLVRRDPALASRAVEVLRHLPLPPDSAWLNRNPRLAALILEAQLSALRHHHDAAALLVEADSALRANDAPWDLVALGNLVVARLWEANGDPARALAAVRRRVFLLVYPPFLATMLREEGRLAELAGDRPGAIEAYRHYLALRSEPEPAIKSEVEQVRAELAKLVGEEGPR